MSRKLSINTNEKAYVYTDNHNMFAISRIASKQQLITLYEKS